MTFSSIIDKWEELILPTHKPSSQASEKTHLTKLRAEFGSLPLDSVNLEKIQRWTVGLTGAPGYVRNLVATLRQVWEMGQAWGYIPEEKRSPFEKLKLPRRRKKEQPYFTEEQSKKLIAMADEPLKTMLWILAETGMRIGEVAALSTYDFDMKNRQIKIRHTAWRGKLGSPKTDTGIRNVDISNALWRHLIEHTYGDGLLFPDAHGRPYNCSNLLTRQLKPLLKKAGIEGGFKAFRHGSASIMADWGINEKARQDRLGHSSFDVTKRYTHANAEYHRQLANRLGEVFCPEAEP